MMTLKLRTILAVATISTTTAIAAHSMPASAAALTWNLQANFDDGGTAKGIFDYDATSGVLSPFNVTTSQWLGSTPAFPAFTYQPASSSATLQNFPGLRYLALNYTDSATMSARNFLALFSESLTEAGGTIALLPSQAGLFSREDVLLPTGSGFFRSVTSGSIAASPTAVPTPALLPGLIGLGLGVLRQKRKAMPSETLG